MRQTTATGTTPSVPLTADEAAALAQVIARAFPPWRIWWAANTWYATGPCRLPECVCSRTLHAPSPSGLCEQLVAVEEAGRKARSS
ncbi:hypothetical protein [Streptosporangium sp. NPDC049078]|uniref:hypothetical protein n=1 Tax=Streptosporangium sp. NPDC049078 TaxID=3155767 RepID=UPI00341769A9